MRTIRTARFISVWLRLAVIIVYYPTCGGGVVVTETNVRRIANQVQNKTLEDSKSPKQEGTIQAINPNITSQHIPSESLGSARRPEAYSQSLSWESLHNDITTLGTYANLWSTSPYWSDVLPWPSTETIALMTRAPGIDNPFRSCGKCRIRWLDVTVKYWPLSGAHTECLQSIQPQGSQLGAAVSTVMDQLRTVDFLPIGISISIGLGDRSNTNQAVKRQAIDPTSSDVLKTQGAPVNVSLPSITLPPIMSQTRIAETSIAETGVEPTISGPVSQVSDTTSYHSPSIYVEIPVVLAEDDCGSVGDQHYDVTTSFDRGEIYSIIPKNVGCYGVFLDQNLDLLLSACSISSRPFDFADLPCPPQSLRAWGQSSFIYDPHFPYNPIVGGDALSNFIRVLDPEWEHCTPEYGWDPFSALTSFPALATPVTVHTPNTVPSRPNVDAGQPPPTVFSTTSHNTVSKSGSHHSEPSDPPHSDPSNPTPQGDPLSFNNEQPNNGDNNGFSGAYAGSNIKPTTHKDSQPYDQGQSHSSTSPKYQPEDPPGQPSRAIVTISLTPYQDLPQGSKITSLGHIIAYASLPTSIEQPYPTAVIIDGSTISVGRVMSFQGGQEASLQSSGNLVFYAAPSITTPSLPSKSVFVSMGHTVSVGTSGDLVVDGETLRAGSAMTAADGIAISAVQGGRFVFGSKTMDMHESVSTPTTIPGELGVTTLGNTIITGQDGNSLIDGQTMTQGAVTATIDDIPVNTMSDGVLVVGSQTFSLIETSSDLPIISGIVSAAAKTKTSADVQSVTASGPVHKNIGDLIMSVMLGLGRDQDTQTTTPTDSTRSADSTGSEHIMSPTDSPSKTVATSGPKKTENAGHRLQGTSNWALALLGMTYWFGT